jgi:hypothetical protein
MADDSRRGGRERDVTRVAEYLPSTCALEPIKTQLHDLQSLEWDFKISSVSFSLQANCTDRLTAEVIADVYGYRGVAWSAQRVPTAINLGFLDRCRYFSFK